MVRSFSPGLTSAYRLAQPAYDPKMRETRGVYYTPAYIVNYIVTNTVGKMIEGKSPSQLSGGKGGQPLRVLDMACGSGSFLLGAYQCLLDHFLKWYLENRPEKYKDAVYFDSRRKFWRLTITEKKRDVGQATLAEYEQAKLARDLAAINFQRAQEAKAK